ncbi:MAG: nucleotidyltransferase family protein [Ruminococcus sp.]|nr:nucleotidyltransferase family protein [Ruminococcus sp.]
MAVAVICEFNPFHNGHAYFLDRVRRAVGEPVIAVMSGSFTQRGEVAVCSKFDRARAALRGGADLVVELPAVRAVSSAQRFAEGGAAVAAGFDCVTSLAFGCETDDLALLKTASDAADDSAVSAIVSRLMAEGEYYPRALQKAAGEVFGEAVAAALSSPNNILAAEYLRALRGTDIRPVAIRRVGAAHDSSSASDGFASASHIRELIRNGDEASAFMPSKVEEPARPERLERALLYRLRTMSAAELAELPEVSEGLENRIAAAVLKYNSTEEILSAVKTKRYTHARLRRILTYALLGITEELQARTPSYARVLGFTEAGAALLKSFRGEVVTSVAAAMRSDSPNRDFLAKDILATDVAALAYDRILPCSADYLTKISKENYAE